MNENVLQDIIRWLKTFPLWQDTLFVDYTDGIPGGSGLFPAGVEEVARREDVLGNVTAQYRCCFDLVRITTGQQDSREHARWLLQFQEWVRQSTSGRKRES